MPVCLDLYCGRGGWTAGYQAAGWDCIGVDIDPQPAYPGAFIQQDVLVFNPEPWRGLIDFVIASSPCTSFCEIWNFSKNPRPCTDLGRRLFARSFDIARVLEVPIIAENVKGAQPFIGPAAAHAGSFYLWGDIPAILPTERFIKGCFKSSKSAAGRKHVRNAAMRAMIPFDLAYHIARTSPMPDSGTTKLSPRESAEVGGR
jgi:hypothetical protein